MADFSEEERAILEYLHERVTGEEGYFRAKGIAESIGLSAKQVGVRLPRLAEKADGVDIEKWGRARSTTWRVTRT